MDHAIRERTVGQDHHAVIGREDLGGGDIDLYHFAHCSLCLYEITRLKRLEGKDHQSSCEVLHGTGERHTDCQTSGCQQRCQRGGVHT